MAAPRPFYCAPLGLLLAIVVCTADDARADGWHNAALATRSLDDWINQTFADLKSTIPDINEQIAKAEVKAGRDISDLQRRADAARGGGGAGIAQRAGLRGKLTAQQQMLLGRKATQCLEILGCMNEKNIFPYEFPNFPMQQIPRYRDAAKQVLKLMGSSGAQAVTAQLRAELMGATPVGAAGLIPAPTYYADLIEVLRDHLVNGNLDPNDLKDLLDAAAGQKNGPQATLAGELQKLLAELDSVPLATLCDWVENSSDSKMRQVLSAKIRSRLPEATVPDLLAVVNSKVDSVTRSTAERQLEKRWREATPLELMMALETLEDPQLRKKALEQLAQRSPTYAEVRPDLPEIWKRLKSPDPQIAAAAEDQLVNAYLRAPISECLQWLAACDAQQDKLIWEQIDDRISRADADRRAGYRASALAAVKASDQPPEVRAAGLDLLGRMKDRPAVGELIEIIALLPRELRPRAGKVLRDITGQNIGPFPGDGTVEVGVAVKKWREWWAANKGR